MAQQHWEAALQLAVSQSGVVRREQLYELGVPRRTLSRAIDRGQWIPRGHGVLVLPGTAEGLLTDSLVAAHAVFPDGVLTGFSALAVLGVLAEDPWNCVSRDPEPWIRVPDHRRVPARVIRAAAGRSRRVGAVPVAREDVVMADLLRFLDGDVGRTLLFRLAQRYGSAELARTLAPASASLGRAAGAAQLRRLLAELEAGAHSDAERELVRLLSDSGISGFIANYPVRISGRRFRIDVAFPEHGLAIEVDGHAFHSSADRFQGDRTRQNLLVSAGWRVLRFTWEDLTRRPEQTLARIAEVLAG